MIAAHARRRFISLLAGLAASPLLLGRQARGQQADSFASLLRQVTGGARVTPGRVKVDTPRLADNGHSVPLSVSVRVWS